MNEPRLIDATALLNHIANIQANDVYEELNLEYYMMFKKIIREFPTYKADLQNKKEMEAK